MRFIKNFFKWLLTLVLIGVVGFFVFREAMLFIAENQIRRELRLLQRTNTWSEVGQRCWMEEEVGATQLQLRFLNDQEYVLEVSCENFQYFPWSEVKSLPWEVKKTTGSAGFWVDVDSREVQGEITLELLNQAKKITGEGKTISSSWGKSDLLSTNLVSSCQAHGLTCCDPVTQAGQGELFSLAVNDCQESCYSSCLLRPNVLFFQTDPALDSVSRLTTVAKDNPVVIFSYAIQDTNVPLSEVEINFGDGTKETFTTLTGQVTKEFACSSSECRYYVTLKATDNRGVVSYDSRISALEVLVK